MSQRLQGRFEGGAVLQICAEDFWCAVSPAGIMDLDRLSRMKKDCVLTASEKRSGWEVRHVQLRAACNG